MPPYYFYHRSLVAMRFPYAFSFKARRNSMGFAWMIPPLY